MGYPTQQQKVDFVFKKLGFTKAKTGVAEDQTSGFSGDTKKAPPNEALASPLVVPATSVWADTSFIPTTPPTSSTAYVGIYTAANAYRMTYDKTVANERTFVARSTAGSQSASIDGDWIDTQFGTDYLIKVYKGDPDSGGTNVSAAGSGANDTWFFDYSAGILNFNGEVDVAGVGTDNVYIVGYRYLGTKGIQPPAGMGTFHNLYVSGISTFVGNVFAQSSVQIGLGLSVAGISTFTGNIDANAGLDVDGTSDLDQVNIAQGLNVTAGIATFAGDIDANADIELAGNLAVTGVSTFTGDIDANADIELAGNLAVTGVSTFTGNIDANGNLDVDGQTDLDELNVTGVSTFSANRNFTGGDTYYGNSINARFGTLSDIRIWGDGSDGYIQGATNTLKIRGKASEESIVITKDAGVQIYYDNSLRLDTTGYGVSITGGTSGIGTLGGPATFHIDPAAVGDNTGTVVIKGNLQVDGTQTTVNSTTMTVDDKNIVLGQGAANDAAVDGGGITLESSAGGSKTWNWVDSTGSWTSSENIDIASGKYLSFAGDTNTHISHPLADTLIVTTAGTERLRIRNDGNVHFVNNVSIAGILTVTGDIDANADIELAGNLAVTGVSTFTGDIDANADIELAGNLAVTGVSTFTSDIDANADIDVAANLNVSGFTTTVNFNIGTNGQSGLVGIATILDEDNMASNRDDALATQQSIKKYVDDRNPAGPGGEDLIVSADSGSNETINLATEVLDIEGTANEIETATGTNKVVIGLPNDVTIGNDLTVTGDLASVTNVNVTGVSTFTDNIFVDSNTAAIGFGTGGTSSALKISADHQNGHAYIQHQDTGDFNFRSDGTFKFRRFSGGPHEKYATFNRDGTVDLYYDNGLRFQTSGIGVTITDQLDVSRIKASGITTTVTLNVGTAGQTLVGINTILDEDDMASDRADALATQQSIKAYVDDQVTAQDLDFFADSGGALSIDLDSESLELAGTANEITTVGAGNSVTFGLPDDVTIGNDLTVTGDIASVTNVNVTGVSTFTGNIDANGNLDVDGQTDLDVLNVAETATFSANIDANGALDVDGTSDLDQVNIADGLNVTAGIATFAGDIDANADIELAGNLAVVGVSTFSAGTVKVTKSVQISENLNVAGITTFQGSVIAPPGGGGGKFGNIQIAVTGDNEIDTSTGNLILDSNGGTINIDDGVTVAGVSTFIGETNIGTGGTVFTALVGAAASVGIGSALPDYMLDVSGAINSEDDVKIQGVSVLTSSLNEAVAMAIALG